jgi:rRNA maturation endonuclease Nob1
MWVDLAIIGMGLGAGYWVGYPLLRPRNLGSPSKSASGNSLRELKVEREEIYSAIREMELDHKMGKLSEEDYLGLREKYKAKALDSLKRMDELERKGDFSRDIQGEIEREVLAIRQDGRKGRAKRGKALFCTQCGRRRSPGDRFCSWCGAKLTRS